MQAATKEPAVTRSAITAKIAEVVSRDVPATVMDASRIVDSEIAAKRRELDELIGQRNKIDANFGVSQKLAAEQAALDEEYRIKGTAEKALALNDKINATVDEAQTLLQAAFAKMIEAQQLFPLAHSTANQVIRSNTFLVNSYEHRLGEHVAFELCRAWPQARRLGSGIVEWYPPAGYDPSKSPGRWSDREMKGERSTEIEWLKAMVEQRRYLDEPAGDASNES